MGFLENFISESNRQVSTDIIFEHFDDLASEGRFEEMDRDINHLVVEMDKLDSFHIRSILVITYTCRDKLKNRAKFYHLAEERMFILKEEADLVKRLIGGLK